MELLHVCGGAGRRSLEGLLYEVIACLAHADALRPGPLPSLPCGIVPLIRLSQRGILRGKVRRRYFSCDALLSGKKTARTRSSVGRPKRQPIRKKSKETVMPMTMG